MTLIFDYDGTIHDTARLYGKAFRSACARLAEEGLLPAREYDDAYASQFIGMTPPDMWQAFAPQLPLRIREEAGRRIGEAMDEMTLAGEAHLYPGTAETLTALKEAGYNMVILSNCRASYMRAHRQAFRLEQWFADFYCAEEHGYQPKEKTFPLIRKDHPDSSYIVIGDRASDFRVGETHGLPVIGCAYGFGSAEELAACDRVIGSPAELPAAIGAITGKA